MVRRPLRELAIAVAVLLHFALGVLATGAGEAIPRDLPVLSPLLDFYAREALTQDWRMFAPPPRERLLLAYALRYPGGWTELRRPLEDRLTLDPDAWLIPRGVDRLRSFVSAMPGDLALGDDPQRQRYFDALILFLCREPLDGQRPRSARIYLVVEALEPFHPSTSGRGDGQVALYERECPEG